jgi:hypothetical protein
MLLDRLFLQPKYVYENTENTITNLAEKKHIYVLENDLAVFQFKDAK